jgi:hypothetical protein
MLKFQQALRKEETFVNCCGFGISRQTYQKCDCCGGIFAENLEEFFTLLLNEETVSFGRILGNLQKRY